MPKAVFTPVTLADLEADGKLLWCWCAACGHEAEVQPRSLRLPMETAAARVRRHLVCSHCGSRNIDTRPQLHDKPIADIRREARERQAGR